jgi:hypothetical protein
MQGFDPNAQGTLAVSARALKERLSRFFPAPQFALELMPAAMTPSTWKVLTQRLPFVGIAFQGFNIPGTAGINPRIEQQWQLHLVVSAGTPELRLLGDKRSPGLVNMGAVAALALHGFVVEDVGTVFCGDAVSLGGQFLADNQAVLGIPLTLATQLIADEAVAALDSLDAIDIDWGFAPDPDAVAPVTPFAGDNTYTQENA